MATQKEIPICFEGATEIAGPKYGGRNLRTNIGRMVSVTGIGLKGGIRYRIMFVVMQQKL